MGVSILADMAIGDRIRNLRKGKELTQEQLARAADVSLSLVARLEQGVIEDPSWKTVRKIARALGVPITKLEDDETTEKQQPGQPKKR